MLSNGDLARWAKAYFEGRAFDPALMPQVLDGVAAPILGCDAFDRQKHRGETPDLVRRMLPSLERSAGKVNIFLDNWVTGAEDFAFFGEKAPSFYFFVGGMPMGSKRSAPHHTPGFVIDDSRLDVGIKAFCNIVFDY